MVAHAHVVHIAGQLRAVDATSITVRRGAKVATLNIHGRKRLRGAKPGDTVKVVAKPDSSGYWAVRKLRILLRAAAPKVRITSGPSGTANTGAATFGFTFSGPVIWLACSLDGSPWFGCKSPAKMPTLGPGNHVFAVLAMNGRHSIVVTHYWKIADTVPPVAPVTKPVNTAPPAITGTAQSKKTIRATAGTWSGPPTGYAYQWYQCSSASATSGCVAIGGATGSSYTCQTADVDKYMRVTVTAVNSMGQTTAWTAATPKTLPS